LLEFLTNYKKNILRKLCSHKYWFYC